MPSNDVNTPGLAYQAMSKAGQWELLDNLWGGTPAMRAARTRHLPHFDAESAADYQARLDLNRLYGFWARTIASHVAKPYSRPESWSEGLPRQLEAWLADVDGAKTTQTGLSERSFQHGLRYGLSHVLVDGPDLPDEAVTVGQAEALRAQPIAKVIAPPNLIDWFPQDGRPLEEIRFRGSDTRRGEDFKQDRVETVTHYTRTEITVWESVDGGEFKLGKQKRNTLGRVPLATFYTNRTGFMTAAPPYLELGEQNEQHWQVMADYMVSLFIVSLERFFTKGFDDHELEAAGKVSTKKALHAKNIHADARWITHDAKGIGSLEAALQKIEDRAEALAARATSRDRSPITATGEVSHRDDEICYLMSWVGAKEAHDRDVLQLAADWMATSSRTFTLPEDFKFQIHRGFTIGPESSREIDQLQADAKERRITTERYLFEAKRRGLYGDDLDPAEEMQEAADEAERRGNDFNEDDEEDPEATAA